MAKNTRVHQPVAAKLGFAIDETSGVIYGTKEGYEVLIYASDVSHPTIVKIAVAVRGPQLTPEQLKQAAADMPDAAKIEQQNNCIIVYPKNVLLAAKLAERVEGALHSTIAFLQQNNFAACCQVCGKEGVMSPVNVADRYLCVCDDCFANLQQELEAATHAAAAKKENAVAGFVGALVGSLIGALCIVVVSRLGYVAAISGLVMAICTLKGYALLGGKLTTKGIVISVILMLFMTYVADRLDWAILVAREFDEDLFISYQAIPELLQAEVIEAANYYGNLALVYVFLLVGAVPTILVTARSQGAPSAYKMAGNSSSMVL